MGFNFPNSPTDGTVYTAATGQQYTYSGGVWLQTGFAYTALQTAQARNRIVNGAMQISQENGNTVGTTNTYFMADQWDANFSTTGTLQCSRAQQMSAYGSLNRLAIWKNTADTSLTAGEFVSFRTKLEGNRITDFQWGLAAAKQVVLRFGFVGPVGTYSVAFVNGAGNRSYVATFNVTATAEAYYTIVIPGDVTGTWVTDNTLALQIYFTIAANPVLLTAPGVWTAGTFVGATGMSNGMATVSPPSFNLFDVGLYLDPQNTGIAPPWTMPDEAQELVACQRYYRLYGRLIGERYCVGQAYSTTVGDGIFFFDQPMRIVPAFAFISPVQLLTATGSVVAPSALTLSGQSSTRAAVVNFTVGSASLTAGQALQLHSTGAAGSVIFSARM